MAQIALASPFRMENATLKLGTNNFEKLVSSGQITPSASTSQFRAISGDVYNFAGKSAFVLDVEYAQDWTTANSLSRFLYENAGTTVAFELCPQGGTAPKFSGTVAILEGAAGGPVNTDAKASVSLPCIGKPALSAVV